MPLDLDDLERRAKRAVPWTRFRRDVLDLIAELRDERSASEDLARCAEYARARELPHAAVLVLAREAAIGLDGVLDCYEGQEREDLAGEINTAITELANRYRIENPSKIAETREGSPLLAMHVELRELREEVERLRERDSYVRSWAKLATALPFDKLRALLSSCSDDDRAAVGEFERFVQSIDVGDVD